MTSKQAQATVKANYPRAVLRQNDSQFGRFFIVLCYPGGDVLGESAFHGTAKDAWIAAVGAA